MKKQFVPDFLQIPQQVFTDRDLSAVDMLVYGMVYWYTHLKGETCFASNRAFAEVLGVRAPKVSESIGRLHRKGYVDVRYEDESKTIRKEIIPLITYSGKGTPNGVGGVLRTEKGGTPNGEHIQNSIKNNYSNASQSSAELKPNSFFQRRQRKDTREDALKMTKEDFVLMCRRSEYRHIRILADYANAKEASFETRGQWREFGIRNLRPAKVLSPYSDRQIAGAFDTLLKDVKDSKGNSGFLSRWSLETIIKYLD